MAKVRELLDKEQDEQDEKYEISDEEKEEVCEIFDDDTKNLKEKILAILNTNAFKNLIDKVETKIAKEWPDKAGTLNKLKNEIAEKIEQIPFIDDSDFKRKLAALFLRMTADFMKIAAAQIEHFDPGPEKEDETDG